MPARGREPAALLEEVIAFAASLSTSEPPAPESPRWVAPPTQIELDRMTDRTIALAQRMERALALGQATSQIVHAYVDTDDHSSGGVHWMASVIRQQGTLVVVVLDELLPTISPQDPTYATRMEGMQHMGHGAFEMVLGVSTTLQEGFAPALRLELVEAVRDHVTSFARLWSPVERSEVARTLAAARDAEQDPEVEAALAAACAALADGP